LFFKVYTINVAKLCYVRTLVNVHVNLIRVEPLVMRTNFLLDVEHDDSKAGRS